MKTLSNSNLVSKHQNLLNKPLKDYTIEDLRLMIGQNTGLEYLIPKAIKVLEINIFAEGDFFEGDLLLSVLKSSKEFWKTKLNLHQEIILLFEKNTENLFDFDTTDEIKEKILKAFDEFKKNEI